MANTKSTTTKNTSSETPIDINAIIKKTVDETSKKFETQLKEDKCTIEKLEAKIKEYEDSNKTINPNKRVKIMYMGAGRAAFNKGRVNVIFDKTFDIRVLKYDIFEEMYWAFKPWFDEFEITVLDKDIRDEFGMEYNFKKHGADKTKFESMLSMSDKDIEDNLNGFSNMLKLSFLKYYLTEYINRNQDCTEHFSFIEDYYKKHFGYNDLNETITTMMSDIN
jgi:hypothetical protein